ncbi:MAG: carboxypeptidase-like regulatory domain-containing protein, partial [Dysgonamonadaceae bacterium]|nr:carboxypeptidase-like regulatory domain-containing protein [Dysgonamonadaceae bacterium]
MENKTKWKKCLETRTKALCFNPKSICLFLSFFLFCAASYAQGRVTGQVLDKTGESVIGASVVVVGTTNGTVTDLDGNYELNNVSQGQVIE